MKMLTIHYESDGLVQICVEEDADGENLSNVVYSLSRDPNVTKIVSDIPTLSISLLFDRDRTPQIYFR